MQKVKKRFVPPESKALKEVRIFHKTEFKNVYKNEKTLLYFAYNLKIIFKDRPAISASTSIKIQLQYSVLELLKYSGPQI